jgi:hypothetical protein
MVQPRLPAQPRERDIDFVMITGAGASREFGVNGTKLALMGYWCEALIKRLNATNLTFTDITGLQPGLSGLQFEQRLGDFLRRVESFGEIEPLLRASTQFPGAPPNLGGDVLPEWHRQTVHQLDQIIEVIRGSLYEEFGAPSIDLGAAASAYSGLLTALGIGNGTRWAYATTNYDWIGDSVIRQLGGCPDYGAVTSTQSTAEGRLVLHNLLDGMPRYTPVLHIHGRVGWYRRRGGEVYSSNITQHDMNYGVPIVMLPDPRKIYDSDDVINLVWSQFVSALRRAKRVFVLGHSLNDAALVRAIAENVEPLDRVGVALLCSPGNEGELDQNAGSVLQTVIDHLGNAAQIPMRFGDGLATGRTGIEKWLERTDPSSH